MLADDNTLYEVSDFRTSEVMNIRAKLSFTNQPSCMCAGVRETEYDDVTDVYIADNVGNLVHVGEESVENIV